MLVLALLVAACGSESAPPPPPECVDADGDGVEAPPCGDDCDDADSRRADPRECSALCAAEPVSLGCPCDGSIAEVDCYTATEDTIGVGECHGGVRRCDGGRWTTCEGEVRPGPELCNLIDDDCDGFVDDGVSYDGCGRCPEGASCDCWGPRDACGGWGDGTQGLTEDEGALVLSAATARWTVRRACAGESATWYLVDVDAKVPDGTAIVLSARIGLDEESLGPPIAIGHVGASGGTFELGDEWSYDNGYGVGLTLELRAEMSGSAEGASPRLDEVRLEFGCFEAGGP